MQVDLEFGIYVHIFKDISFFVYVCMGWEDGHMSSNVCVHSNSGVKIILQNVRVIVKKFHAYRI
jgi:hypothetical protein